MYILHAVCVLGEEKKSGTVAQRAAGVGSAPAAWCRLAATLGSVVAWEGSHDVSAVWLDGWLY